MPTYFEVLISIVYFDNKDGVDNVIDDVENIDNYDVDNVDVDGALLMDCICNLLIPE